MTTKGHADRVFNIFSFSTSVAVRILYFALAVLVIAALTYLFGYHILIGALKGGDAGHAFHNLFWYSRWLPRIPIWYPGEGGGFAFSLNYSLGSILASAFLNKISTFDLNQSLRVITFGSYFFTALGVYFFGAWRMRNQTLGLIAALLFLTLPGPWFWITKLGYYALAVATSFIPWGMIFFDWFLESMVEGKSSTKRIVALLLASFVLGLAFNTHGFAGAPLALGFFIYGPVVGALRNKKLLSFRGIKLGFLAAFLVTLTTVFLFAFWFLPVLNYSRLASLGGGQNAPAELIIRWAEVQNPRRLLLDWSQQPISDQFPMPPFPRIVSYLIITGFVTSFFFGLARNRLFRQGGVLISAHRAFGLAGLGFFFLIWVGLPRYINLAQIEKLRFIYSYLQFRVIAVSYILLPLVAAFAIFAISWIVTEIPLLILYLFHLRKNYVVRFLKKTVVSLLSLLIFINLLVIFEKSYRARDFYGFGPPEDPISNEKEDLGYKGFYFRSSPEPFSIDTKLLTPKYYIDLAKNSFAYSAILQMIKTPPEVSSVGFGLEKKIKDIVLHMDVDQFSRVGLTGYIGALLQEWNTYTDAPTLNQFHFQGSLFQSMRGFQETVFFGKDERNHRPRLLDDLARYIGYKYVVVSNAEDTKHYLADTWELIGEEGALQIYEFKDYQGMVSISKRPRILVIGTKKGAYENVFRAAAEGVLPYEKAWLIQGGERVDKYSYSELKKFDGLILYGYSYKSRNKAFSLLDRYIKEGGRVFIDTGWQFVSKDWQLENAPSFFPVTGLKWTDNIAPRKHSLTDSQSKVLGVSNITLEWEGQSWGVSEAEGLKDWAKPLLTIEGKTLMAGGDYGEGKVIWSGLNLFGYLSYRQYEEGLINLGFSIFNEIYPKNFESEDIVSTTLTRDFPDEVEIKINSTLPEKVGLLWREPYSPDWKVVMENGKTIKLATYRAGPGFLMTILPETKGPSTVVLTYNLGLVGALGKMVSILSIIFFASLIFDQVINRGKWIKRIMSKLVSFRLVEKFQLHIKDPKASLRKFWEEE